MRSEADLGYFISASLSILSAEVFMLRMIILIQYEILFCVQK